MVDADTFMWAAISSVVQPRTTSIATANSVEVRLSATWWPVSGLWIGDGVYFPSPASLSQRHWYCSQNRISTVAACARVASPWGVRVLPSPVPLMIPAPQAHWRAETAYSDTSKASA